MLNYFQAGGKRKEGKAPFTLAYTDEYNIVSFEANGEIFANV